MARDKLYGPLVKTLSRIVASRAPQASGTRTMEVFESCEEVIYGVRRAGAEDAVSLLVQAFLEVPLAFEYAARRLAGRPAVRETMGRVMGDLVPASAGLDPRFLAALLRP